MHEKDVRRVAYRAPMPEGAEDNVRGIKEKIIKAGMFLRVDNQVPAGGLEDLFVERRHFIDGAIFVQVVVFAKIIKRVVALRQRELFVQGCPLPRD
jgi:hypothetical protein